MGLDPIDIPIVLDEECGGSMSVFTEFEGWLVGDSSEALPKCVLKQDTLSSA